MSTRPVIFISSVSKELHTTRTLVATTLTAIGYDPKLEDTAPTDQGDLLGILRNWIDSSDAIIQLVGHCYGLPLQDPHPQFGPCSHTQYEAHYAHQKGKKVYYILLDKDHPTDGCGCEPKTLHDLQEKYRQQVKASGDLYHSTNSLDKTELLVYRVQDKLAQLRAEAKASHDLLHQKADLMLQALRELPQSLSQQPRGDTLEEEASRTARAYIMLEGQLRLPPGSLAKELPLFALQLLQRKDTSALDRANALFATQKFAEAEAEALKARDHALAAAGQPVQEAVTALWLAGQSAQAQMRYAQAMEHYRAAAYLTGNERDVLQWLDLQNAISWLYHLQGCYPEFLAQTQQVWQTAQHAGQDESRAVLIAHMHYACALEDNGQAAAAEPEHRAVIKVQECVLGAENYDTLASRNNLANSLDAQGKHVEAEQEHRSVLKIKERVLGAEHPDTLSSRNNLAACRTLPRREEDAKSSAWPPAL